MKYKSIIFSFLGSIAFLLIFSWSTSPLYLTYGWDSPFFQMIGLGITQGKVPYVDLFDHKGPVPFFMDALGYSLGLGKTGLFIVQVLSMTVTISLFYKLAVLFLKSSRKAVAAVALSMIPLVDFIAEGNQVEEWQLPYIALTLFLVCRYIKDGSGEHPAIRSLIYGLCFGMVFYNRPNDGVMWVGSLFFGLLLMWMTRREWKRLFSNLLTFLSGFVIVSIPIFIYFGVHGAIGDLWFGMIEFNLKYAGDALITWGWVWMMMIPLIIAGTFLIVSRDHRDFRFLFIPMLVFVIIFIGKREYYHYLIPFTPFVVICFAECIRKRWKAYLGVVCSLFAIFSFNEFSIIATAAVSRSTLRTFYEQTDALFDAVPENERNNVWNYNLVTYQDDRKHHLVSMMGCFLHKGITTSSPILASFDLFYLEDVYGIRARNPEWVVFDPEDSYVKDLDWIYDNYEFVAESPSEPVCSIKLYKRKR